eukprot:COSAG06_NODE_48210_length_333_cov_8.970085_1_plen_61_part_01
MFSTLSRSMLAILPLEIYTSGFVPQWGTGNLAGKRLGVGSSGRGGFWEGIGRRAFAFAFGS